MTTRIIETEQDRRKLVAFLSEQKLPVTVRITTGGKRTAEQNKLMRLWAGEIAEQMGCTAEYARGYCKLTVGVPILRDENDEFREKYDRVVKPLSFDQKIELMQLPLDFPITRLMTVKQQTRFLDEVYRHFAEKGYILTLPEDRIIEQYTGAPPSPVKGGEAVYPPPQPGEVMPPQTSPGDHIDVRKWTSKEETYLKEYARKALDDLAKPNQSVGYVRELIGSMKRNYKQVLESEDALKIMEAMDAPFNAVIAGKRTIEQAQGYIARDLIGCPERQIGEVRC